MSAKRIKKKAVERYKYKTYLKKAGEFYNTMFQAKEMERWNAVGLRAALSPRAGCL